MEAEQYAKYSCDLAAKAKSAIRDINPLVFIKFILSIQNDLEFLRIRARNTEIVIAPSKLSYFIVYIEDDFIVTLTQTWNPAPLPPPPTPANAI